MLPQRSLDLLETTASNLAGDVKPDAWAAASEEKKFHWRLKAAKMLFEARPENKE